MWPKKIKILNNYLKFMLKKKNNNNLHFSNTILYVETGLN
jgi:hypothetical protein